MSGDVVELLRAGLVLVGESETDGGTIELFDTDEAETAMAEAADLITSQAAEIERLREERDEIDRVRVEQSTRLLRRAETAERLLAEARAALEFYAAPENYKGAFVPGGQTEHGTFVMAHHVNIIRRDAGALARSTLTNGGENGR